MPGVLAPVHDDIGLADEDVRGPGVLTGARPAGFSVTGSGGAMRAGGDTMAAFGEKQIQAAIARLGGMGSKEIRELRARGESQNLTDFVAACDAELASRPVEFSQVAGADFPRMEAAVRDLDLVRTIRYAFTDGRRASAEELRFLQWIALHPGASHAETLAFYGKGDLALMIGHLAYDRYGCFRKFMTPGGRQSGVLLDRDTSGPSVRYQLKPEAVQALTEIGVLG